MGIDLGIEQFRTVDVLDHGRSAMQNYDYME